MAEQMEIENPQLAQEEIVGDTNDCKLNESNQCHSCLLSNKAVIALKYCNECEEKLCEDCVTSHAKRKATSSHKPIPVDKMTAESTSLCSPCKDADNVVKAVTYCKDCDEYLCTDCTNSHRKRKATKSHEPIAVERLKDQGSQSDEMLPLCEPCKDNGIDSRSVNYCKVCDEYLCEPCTKSHRTRKATKSHDPVPVTLLQQEEHEHENVNQDTKLCLPCLIIGINKIAKSYCAECEELLCIECTNQHRSKKLTKSHSLESPECFEYVTRFCDICDLKDKEAIMFCNTCEDALCETCAQKHKIQKASKSHSTEAIQDKPLKRVITCNPCKENDEIKKAETYCKVCEEHYCETCTRRHGSRKATKQHELIHPASDNNGKNPEQEVKICGECEDKNNAFKYCSECQHYLCDKCSDIHIRSKFTKNHSLVEPWEVEEKKQHDCESCNTPGAAQNYCKQCEEFFCKSCSKQHQKLKNTRQHTLVSTEEGLVHRNALKEKCEEPEFRVQDNGKLDVRATKPSDEQPKKASPGKPRASNVLADAITLSWDPPPKFEDDDYYQVSYKDLDHDKKWKCFQGEFKTATAELSDLKSNTAFIFRVRVVYEDVEGPYSEKSDKIHTSDSPASRIVKFSVVKEKGKPSPTTYALPITEITAARNEKAKTKKFEIGAPPIQNGKSKTIMLVGATGTGKSTLVDGIVNYVLGVNWDDPFRFTVIDLEKEEKDREKNQALSQTEWITCYTLNPEKGSRLNYQLHILDTPGFGDTRGLKRDQEIVEQIRELFSEREPKGVTFIDAVCFLIKAPDARLTAVQSYIFQSVMSLFGRDIEKNICSLVTFADGIDPPVLAALRESGLPFGKSFTFNNSGLFAKNADISTASLSPMFWDMGLKSFRAFFNHIDQVETKSLKLTKDVLDERSRLEATVKNLQPQLDAGLSKVNGLKQEIQIIERNKSLIKDNKNFNYEVDETQQKRKELPRGVHVTNCTHCHFTCHDNCVFANDDEKANCGAMDPSTGNCKICPDKCYWKKHANTPYIFEYVTVKVKKTYADMQQKYKEATGKLLSQEQIVEKLGEELNDLLDDIEDMMIVIKSCNERLKETALRPNPLSMTEHIDLMIENEKLEKKDGFLQRITILNDFRKRAQISKDFEDFSKAAHSTLGAVGKKRNRDAKSILAKFGSWFSNKLF